ncbi:MAG: recombination mediator RecR [Pseudomonadota bacterium]
MSESLARLIHNLSKLPGVGERTATRLAFYILKQPAEYSRCLSQSLLDVKDKVGFCSHCQNLTEVDPCRICSDHNRDQKSICVVEDPSDALAIERTHAFKGTYHILHGAISPLDGIGPGEIKASELMNRLARTEVSEVILATNSDVEGETTALYISKLIKPLKIKVTRLASGIPVGGELEYIDPNTLSRALEARREL